MKISIMFTALSLTACLSPGAESSSALPAEATAIYAGANAELARREEAYQAAQAIYRSTVEASERYESTQSAVQSTLDASHIAAAQANVDAAKINVTIAASDAALAQIKIVSAAHAMTTSMAVLDAQSQNEIDAANDPLKQIIAYAPTCAVAMIPLAIIYCLIILARAAAARLAGDDERAYHALSVMPPLTIFQIAGPTAPPEDEDPDQNSELSYNTTTLENTHNTDHNTEFIPKRDNGREGLLDKMTHAERDELLRVRHEAIGLLSRCVDYYRRSNLPDDGTIPRYDELHMDSEARGLIARNLEYSGLVSIIKNKRTFVELEIGSCAELLNALVTNQKRVYPVGYAERRQERIAQAVQSLPLREKENGR